MKRLSRILLLVTAVAVCSTAVAVEPTVITFTAPTTYTDGSAIDPAAAITYGVYQAVKGATKVKVATISTTGTTISTGLVPGTTYCFAVTAIIAGQESAQSAEACKLTPALVPSAVVITVK